MTKIVRPTPRGPAWLYPVGTQLTLNDGRVFEVSVSRISTVGMYGDIEWHVSQRTWKRIND